MCTELESTVFPLYLCGFTGTYVTTVIHGTANLTHADTKVENHSHKMMQASEKQQISRLKQEVFKKTIILPVSLSLMNEKAFICKGTRKVESLLWIRKKIQQSSPSLFLRCGKSYIPTVPSCMNNWLTKSVTSYKEFTMANWIIMLRWNTIMNVDMI